MVWDGHVARISEPRNSYNILIGKPEGRDHLEKLGIWEDNIRLDVREIGWDVWAGCILLRIGTSGGLL